jgi:hypothetical protein
MSLVAMVDASMARRQAADATKVSPAVPVGVSTTIANQITRWIPTETITIYVALLALVAPHTALSSSFTSRWVLFSIVTAATPVVVVLLGLAKASGIHDFKFPVFEMIISPVAFAAWAFSLPDTPLSSLGGYDIKWNAAIVTVTTVAITLIANALHLSPDFDQVVTKEQGANPMSPERPPADPNH